DFGGIGTGPAGRGQQRIQLFGEDIGLQRRGIHGLRHNAIGFGSGLIRAYACYVTSFCHQPGKLARMTQQTKMLRGPTARGWSAIRPRSVTGLVLASFALVALPMLAATLFSVS